MKKTLIISALLLSLILCACTGQTPAAGESTPGITPSPDKTESNSASNPSSSVSDELTLPILDEISKNVTVATAGSFMGAAEQAIKMLDWGMNTGLETEEIRDAATRRLSSGSADDQKALLEKLALVDDAYQKLLGNEAEGILDSIGYEGERFWGSEPVESIEAVMDAAGFRD